MTGPEIPPGAAAGAPGGSRGVSAWLEALEAADTVRKSHGLRAAATGTTWLDGRVGGSLGVRVTLPDGREVTGTAREIGARVAEALAGDGGAHE